MKNISVKFILLALIFAILLSVSGCGFSNNSSNTTTPESKEPETTAPKSKEIALTSKNYSDYLDVGYSLRENKDLHSSFYGSCSFSVSGNTHYKYKNVEIKVRVWGYGGTDEWKAAEKANDYKDWLFNSVLGKNDNLEMPTPDFDYTETIRLNLAGSASKTVSIFGYVWENWTHIEFVSISGTVEEY